MKRNRKDNSKFTSVIACHISHIIMHIIYLVLAYFRRSIDRLSDQLHLNQQIVIELATE